MGIDVYARWKGQTEQERQAQYTGFSVTAGNVGYLREAYHGRPYATRVLVPEAFAANDCEAQIPAAALRGRLPEVLTLAMIRSAVIYKQDLAEGSVEALQVCESFVDFVDLCERKEAETGKPVTIIASY